MDSFKSQVAKLRAQGHKNKVIAEKLGVSFSRVMEAISQLVGEGKVKSRWPKARWTEKGSADFKRVVKLLQSGANLAEIGEVFGVSRERARQIREKIRKRYGDEIVQPRKQPYVTLREAAREVVAAMRAAGMTPGRAVIAHAEMFFASQDIAALVSDPLASRVNVDFARELLDDGFNISIDSFGHCYDAESLGRTYIADWQRLAGLVQLVDAGCSSRIVLGTDVFLKILTRRRGGEGYARLAGFAIPMLQRLGVDPAHLAAMTVGNPARILAR